MSGECIAARGMAWHGMACPLLLLSTSAAQTRPPRLRYYSGEDCYRAYSATAITMVLGVPTSELNAHSTVRHAGSARRECRYYSGVLTATLVGTHRFRTRSSRRIGKSRKSAPMQCLSPQPLWVRTRPHARAHQHTHSHTSHMHARTHARTNVQWAHALGSRAHARTRDASTMRTHLGRVDIGLACGLGRACVRIVACAMPRMHVRFAVPPPALHVALVRAIRRTLRCVCVCVFVCVCGVCCILHVQQGHCIASHYICKPASRAWPRQQHAM